MYPGYTAKRPKMQIYHGGADKVLNGKVYEETIKQWCGVLGLNHSHPTSVSVNDPGRDYTTQHWEGKLEGIWNPAVGHSVPFFGDKDMKWFGFM
jgi:acetylxylan esterase